MLGILGYFLQVAAGHILLLLCKKIEKTLILK